ncbi:MAG: PH domain-containing protein [Pyrobaculum sp.]
MDGWFVKSSAAFLPVEEVAYWRGRMSWRANAGHVVLSAALFLLALFVGHLALSSLLLLLAVLTLLYAYLRVHATEYAVTSARIYARYGIVARKITQTKPENVSAVHVQQSAVGRLLNYGDAVFMTPGEGGYGYVVFRGVENPVALKSAFFSLVKKIKERIRLEELIRELERECDFGRIPEDRCAALRQRYEEELKKLEWT